MLVALSLLAVTSTMSSVAEAVPPPEPPADGAAKVDDQVLAAVEDGGTTTFWVRLAEQADLSAATAIEDWAERGSYVVKQLRATADASQAPVRAELDASGAAYTSYWITNALRVRGDEALVDELAKLPSVDAILAPVTYEIPEPTEVTANRVNAVEWGIARINADDVWSQAGDTIVGGAGVNVVLGNGGADLLQGQGGNDRLDGGTGNDGVSGQGGNDLVHGQDGATLCTAVPATTTHPAAPRPASTAGPASTPSTAAPARTGAHPGPPARPALGARCRNRTEPGSSTGGSCSPQLRAGRALFEEPVEQSAALALRGPREILRCAG